MSASPPRAQFYTYRGAGGRKDSTASKSELSPNHKEARGGLPIMDEGEKSRGHEQGGHTCHLEAVGERFSKPFLGFTKSGFLVY